MLEFVVANNVLAEIFLFLGTMVITICGSKRAVSQRRFFLFFTIVFIGIATFIASDYFLLNNEVSLSGFFLTSKYIIFSKIIVAVLTMITVLLAMGYENKKLLFRPSEFSILVVLSVLGAFVLLSANDLIVMYCGLELQAICLYVLTSCDRDDIKSSEAGMKYFIAGVIASILLLYGISLIFGFTGTTNFSVLVEQVYSRYVQGVHIPVGFIVGIILVIVSISIKVAFAPFHFWAPDVYQGAPLPVTALLSTVPKVALILFFVRFFYTVLYPWHNKIDNLFQVMIVLSLLVGSLGALRQDNIKRLLAYSAIFHIGFVFIGILSGSSLGVSAVVSYLFIYSVMTFGMFAFISVIQTRKKKEDFDLSIFCGLSKTNPVMAFSISVLLLSMAGFPPFAGFLAKFYIIMAAIHAKLYIIVIIALLFSVISTYYYLRIIKIMYFDKESKNEVDYFFSTENVIVATIATVFNFILILSPTGLNTLVSMVTHNLLK